VACDAAVVGVHGGTQEGRGGVEHGRRANNQGGGGVSTAALV
jgi:hypothetical protein